MSEPISELLSALKKGKSAEDVLIKHYFDMARERAVHLIGDPDQARFSPTSIANEAIRQALQEAGQGRLKEGASREDFRKFLMTIVDRRWKDKLDEAHAGKRDVDREIPMTDPSQLPDWQRTPEQLAVTLEDFRQVQLFVIQEPDPVKLLINMLAFLTDYGPPEIHRLLLEKAVRNPGQPTAPSLRTIQLHVQKMIKKLREQFPDAKY